MDEQVRQLAEQLLKTGFDQLSDRERRVITGVAKRTQISRDASHAFEENLTAGDRLADRVAAFGGSWVFITIFLGVLVAWSLFNSVVVLAWSVAASTLTRTSFSTSSFQCWQRCRRRSS